MILVLLAQAIQNIWYKVVYKAYTLFMINPFAQIWKSSFKLGKYGVVVVIWSLDRWGWPKTCLEICKANEIGKIGVPCMSLDI